MKIRGRKRKSGNREKNGRLQRDPTVRPEQIAARMPHRASEVVYAEFHSGTVEVKRIVRSFVPIAELHNEKAESPFGRLRLVGAISEEQYLAGRQFAREVQQYRRVLDIKRDRESIAGIGQPGSPTPKELDDKKAVEILASYMDAYGAIGSRASQCAIKHIVIQELELGADLFRYLTLGLNNLVRHYGLTT